MIHFISLFSPYYDADLLQRWIKHYLFFGFDEYTVYLHCPDNWKTVVFNECFDLLKYNHVTVIKEPRRYSGGGGLRETVMEEYRAKISKTDYMVTADSDEIHHVMGRYPELIQSVDYIEGSLEQRSDATLHKASPAFPLSDQYPQINCVPPCPMDRDHKILAARADVPVLYNGSHHIAGTGEYKKSSGHIVRHYPWRHNAIERMIAKPYMPVEYIRAVCAHFDVPVPETVELKRRRDRATHEEIMERSSP